MPSPKPVAQPKARATAHDATARAAAHDAILADTHSNTRGMAGSVCPATTHDRSGKLPPNDEQSDHAHAALTHLTTSVPCSAEMRR